MKKRWAVAAAAVAAWWWWPEASDAPPPGSTVQAAVLPQGYAAAWRTGGGYRVVETDEAGRQQHAMTVALDRDARFVGTRSGTAVGWLDGKRVKLAMLDDDGEPEEPSAWGKQAVALCSGAASNEHRFGVGWLEGDGTVWFVHGAASASSAEPQLLARSRVSWCAVASAERNVALVWREGSRTFLNFCTERRCSGTLSRVPIDDKEPTPFGCVKDRCLFPTRDKRGGSHLFIVDDNNRGIHVQLADVAPEHLPTVAGVGGRAFALAYVDREGRTAIRRLALDGTSTGVWHLEAKGPPPALAWARGRLAMVWANGSVGTFALEP